MCICIGVVILELSRYFNNVDFSFVAELYYKPSLISSSIVNVMWLLMTYKGDSLTTLTFCCIICLYFGISNLKIYPVCSNSFKYIFPDLNTNNAQFGIFTSFWRLFLYKSEDEMSSPSHTCICLQIINWLSYLHTKTAKMLQTWQYKSHPKNEFNAHAILKYTTFISKFSEKNGRVRQFFHCDTNTYI